MIGDFFGRQHTGSLAGFIFAFGSLSSALGPIATGLIADRTGSYTTAFLCATAVNGLALLLLALARPPASKPGAWSTLPEQGSAGPGR